MCKCKKCGTDFEPQKGFVNYCSMECRNSRTWSDEDKLKKSESAKNSEKVKIAISLASEAKLNMTTDRWGDIKSTREKNRKSLILNSEYSDLTFGRLRERVLYEQDCKCNRCGLSEWLGEPISLELEHKDGNHHNNQRDNLEILCPNCHSLTLTWRGRNKQSDNRLKISDEVLLESLCINDWNMRQALMSLGLAAKGGNYKRCHKLKREYEEHIM